MSVRREVQYSNSSGGLARVLVDKFPDICPACRRGVESIFTTAFSDNPGAHGFLQAVFRCPREECKKFFIGYYVGIGRVAEVSLRLSGCDLLFHQEKEGFDEIIEGISKQFPVIYNQALIAEKNGLDQICGPGYRKALEFLVKDYLIKKSPKEEEKISQLKLSSAIGQIKDENIRSCAKRAAWIGNDETHYERKWTDKDLSHLKELIILVVNWITNIEITGKYKEEMPEKAKAPGTNAARKGK